MDLETAYQLLMGALTIWREARGESRAGKLAVWWVIKNRVADGRWGDKISEVVTYKWQFSCFNANDPNAVLFPKHDDWAWIECLEIVESTEPDPTGGAKFYYANWLPKTPDWSLAMIHTTQIDQHQFCREV